MGKEEDIFHWRPVNDILTTSGQPSEEQLVALAELGISTIVNLGMHDHERALPDEQASVTALGMRYIHIPVPFDAPTDANFETFCATLQQIGDGKTHIHCIANLRVTAFLYRYWHEVCGWPEPDARALMDSVWRPGGVWAAFIGDGASVELEHRSPKSASIP